MSEKRTSVFSNGLIWFGAGVSLAEILTGTYFAPLGFGRAMAAILLGHLIGGLMMFAAGMIGAKERKSAMETVKMSFGEKGSLLFAVLNVLQLVGWTAIMIYDGALAADGLLHSGISESRKDILYDFRILVRNQIAADENRNFDHSVDLYRTDQSWKVKYRCNDRTLCIVTGTF